VKTENSAILGLNLAMASSRALILDLHLAMALCAPYFGNALDPVLYPYSKPLPLESCIDFYTL
jgi:hypothetical protein